MKYIKKFGNEILHYHSPGQDDWNGKRTFQRAGFSNKKSKRLSSKNVPTRKLFGEVIK